MTTPSQFPQQPPGGQFGAPQPYRGPVPPHNGPVPPYNGPPPPPYAAGPVQPVGAAPTPVAPLAPPEDGRVVVAVNRISAAIIAVVCVAVAIVIVLWLQYDGSLFEFDDGGGRVTRGTIMIHILPLILVVVAIVYLVKLLDSKPKLVFEGGGVQVRDKNAPDGVNRVPWSAIGRVYIHESVAVDKKGRPRKNQRPTKKWQVQGRDGRVLASIPASGNKPDPDIGLGQVAAIAQGRALVG